MASTTTKQNSTTTQNSNSTTTQSSKSTTTQNSGSTSTSSSTSKTAATGTVDANVQKAYDNYNANGYQQSQSVSDAYNYLQSVLNNKPGDFSSAYSSQLSSLYDQIANREKFSYDFNTDPMYQLYKEKYTSQGKDAMQDTMGQAAALTGGYGSSYSQTAGQQAYQSYLQELNDVIPELREQAYEQYTQEGEDLYNQFGLANTMYGNEYEQYRDTVSDYQTDRDYAQNAYTDERDFDYDKYTSDRDYIQEQFWNQLNSEQTTTANSTQSSNSWSNSTTDSSSTSTTNSSSTSSSSSSSSSSTSSSGSSGSSSSTAANTSVYKNGSNNNTTYNRKLTTGSMYVNDLAARVQLNAGSDAAAQKQYLYNMIGKNGFTQGDYLYMLDKLNLD